MHPRIFFFRRIAVLTALAVYFFVVLCPTAVLRLVSGCECHFVYTYFVEDEANGTTETRTREVLLSEADKEALLGELVHSERTSPTNCFHSHALIFHLPLGMKVTVLIQSYRLPPLQLHALGSGISMEPETVERFWRILDRYIIDDHVAICP